MSIVTFESVAAAAESLQTAGQRTSVRNVIASLGGGSPNAVLKYLSDWKSGRPVVRAVDIDLDPAITNAISLQMQRIAAAAAASAEERATVVDDDLQALSEAHQVAEQQIEILMTERDSAVVHVDELNARLIASVNDARRDAINAEEKIAVLRADLAAQSAIAIQSASDKARAEVRLEALPALNAEVDRLRAELVKERQERINAEQSAAVLKATLDASQARANELNDRLNKTESAYQGLVKELSIANVAVQAGQARLESAARELDSAKELAKELRREAKNSGEEAAELRGKVGANAADKSARAK